MKTVVLYGWDMGRAPQSLHTIKLFELFKTMDDVTAVRLRGADAPFDAKREQEFLDQFDNIILLFPVNWFSTPWTMKRYLDEVFIPGYSLNGKKVYLVTTAGAKQETYDNRYLGANMHEFLAGIRATITCMGGVNGGEWTYYSAISEEGLDAERFDKYLAEIQSAYQNIISKGLDQPTPGAEKA